jgi:hypothetical protein
LRLSGQEWAVRVAHRDLAILEFDEEPPDHRHFASRDATIALHAPGNLIGFPNWNNGRRANIERPFVTARFPRTWLQRFEINQLIRKANSGEVSVDELFRVAGVVQQGAQQDAGTTSACAWLS